MREKRVTKTGVKAVIFCMLVVCLQLSHNTMFILLSSIFRLNCSTLYPQLNYCEFP